MIRVNLVLLILLLIITPCLSCLSQEILCKYKNKRKIAATGARFFKITTIYMYKNHTYILKLESYIGWGKNKKLDFIDKKFGIWELHNDTIILVRKSQDSSHFITDKYKLVCKRKIYEIYEGRRRKPFRNEYFTRRRGALNIFELNSR